MGQLVILMTEEEMAEARAFGRARFAACRERGQLSGGPTSVGQDALAAAAEIALARAMNLPRDTSLVPQRHGAGDVGPLEVRHTLPEDGHLLLQPHDADGAPYVLVTGKPPTLTVRGWLPGGAGKRDWYWRTDVGFRPCYWIPQADLRDLAELAGMLDLWRWAHAWDGVAHDEERDLARLPASASARRLPARR